MSIVIEAEGLSKWFGEVVAVNNVGVTIEEGVTGLLGPNGAGKSTFIKLCLGLYKPSRGTLSVFGERPRNNLDVLQRIAYCPETNSFYDSVSGFEFVYWLTRQRGLGAAAANKAAGEACERVRMADRMNDLIGTYSTGMRQRIKLAQAIACESDLMFLDEPMSGLDPKSREETYAIIRELGSEGRTVIVSSHILYEVERVTNNIVVLHNGQVLARGHVRDIRGLIDEHPHAVTVESPQVRAIAEAFVGEPSTLSVDFVGGGVTIRTSDPNHFYKKLNDMALDRDLAIESIRCPDDSLQAVFDYLVK
jgi:ABC-2 type transport system ATP-binding protein